MRSCVGNNIALDGRQASSFWSITYCRYISSTFPNQTGHFSPSSKTLIFTPHAPLLPSFFRHLHIFILSTSSPPPQVFLLSSFFPSHFSQFHSLRYKRAKISKIECMNIGQLVMRQRVDHWAFSIPFTGTVEHYNT